MYRGVKQTGIVALGVGTFAYLCHRKQHNYSVLAAGSQNDQTLVKEQGLTQDKPTIPLQDGSPQLKLLQVQVMFRHGARTPLHLISRIPEADYNPQFIMREHQASQFPYEKVLYSTGKPADWSTYEVKLTQTLLRSGVPCGALTAYGKDQTYLLGRRLRTSYRDILDMSLYNPKDVLVLSSNIKRTVESAKAVLAGYYGKEELQAFALRQSSVKIYVTDMEYNILVPNTYNCAVLKKVNHAGIMHGDFIPGLKSDRLIVEKEINDVYDKKIEAVRTIQERINMFCGSSVLDDCYKKPTKQPNEHHQTHVRDLHALVEERGQAIDRVDRLWTRAMIRNPTLANVITEEDMKALVYLRRLEVERVDGKFHPGYRLHLYFDTNPFFNNGYLCKEIYSHRTPGSLCSKSSAIAWKEGGKSFQDGLAERKIVCQCQVAGNAKNSSTKSIEQKQSLREQEDLPISFFEWYLSPTCLEHDEVWKAIRDEIWTDPVKYLEGTSKVLDKWERNLNFVFARDDLVARVTHGFSCPAELEKYETMIEDNATKMLYYAMTGQHEAERTIVSRLSAGPLLTTMVEQSQKVISGKSPTYKMCLYSSHDSAMCGLLELLGIWDNKWPPFAADVRLELYKDTNSSEYFVRILYCGKVQKICGQEKDLLSWSDFIKVINKQLIHQDEYLKLCSSDILEKFAKDLLKHEVGEVIKPSETPAGM